MKSRLLLSLFVIATVTAPHAFAGFGEDPLRLEEGTTGDWAGESGRPLWDGLVNDVVYKGDPVPMSDAIARSTYRLEVFDPGVPDLKIPGCTATLIAKDIALTAAHCLQDKPGLRMSLRYFSLSKGGSQAVNVAAFRAHGKYSLIYDERRSAVVSHDIALLRLEKPITEGVIAVLPRPGLILKNQKVIAAGYGENALPEPTVEQLQRDPRVLAIAQKVKDDPNMSEAEKENLAGQLLTLALEKPLLMTTFMATRLEDKNARGFGKLDLRGRRSICAGDSGGPSFVRERNGRLVVVGVHSTSTGKCSELGAWNYLMKNYGNHDTNVSDYVDWIQETVKRLRADREI